MEGRYRPSDGDGVSEVGLLREMRGRGSHFLRFIASLSARRERERERERSSRKPDDRSFFTTTTETSPKPSPPARPLTYGHNVQGPTQKIRSSLLTHASDPASASSRQKNSPPTCLWILCGTHNSGQWDSVLLSMQRF
ncbi:hypothetical protein BHM03_00062339 [Ensete ventricosum]|nr:hypothetical protein BHM03_00062339 [Ensete ventricosum]